MIIDCIRDIASLNVDDIVVHVDHGIGSFVGLKTITAAGSLHDFIEIRYAGDDRLFLPVENIELLSRYGAEGTDIRLDKLGSTFWQVRKAKLKKCIQEIAGQLIALAAQRQMLSAPKFAVTESYNEFVARFPYNETDDQSRAINAVLNDLSSGRPMDRIICGDVGFGKTEIAIRAAFITVMSGFQVAVMVPTRLLASQHHKTFSERFQGLPIGIGHASHLVSTRELSDVRKAITNGTLDIIIGTQVLLGHTVQFAKLGLIIVDEEQRFGVQHKEWFKKIKADVHVLTLSATPIPRTLQLALTGVRELSLVATPPINRMGIKTSFAPLFDLFAIRKTLLREHNRAGQSFYVCPHISDLEKVFHFLKRCTPELKIAIAHSQMASGQLNDVMNAFYDGRYNVLLSTSIIESGLDIPNANTLIVHRANMFGLTTLYQLRGRVGRSRKRAYALFTLPTDKMLIRGAEQRLEVLQSLNVLGSGFQIASYDMDIRGAGNLFGEEQSGHIKEVGFELYQKMLEEAITEMRGTGKIEDEQWSPQILTGISVLIPESYISDIQLRLDLYRHVGALEDARAINAFSAELIDQFGPLPNEVQNLLKVVHIKVLCRKANVEKLDAGPKGLVISFRNGFFANGMGLIKMIAEQGSMAKIRSNKSIVFVREWPLSEQRLYGIGIILNQIIDLLKTVHRR